jgi:hypothetical protein
LVQEAAKQAEEDAERARREASKAKAAAESANVKLAEAAEREKTLTLDLKDLQVGLG